jgi:hypothetical protein
VHKVNQTDEEESISQNQAVFGSAFGRGAPTYQEDGDAHNCAENLDEGVDG